MKKVLSFWKDYLTVESSLQRRSVEAYLADVRDFTLFMEQEKDVILPKNIELNHLLDYLGLLKEVGAAETTLARRCSSISMFLTFLHEEEFIGDNPVEDLPRPRTGKSLPHILSPDQVDELLTAPSPDERHGCRDRALLELLYATGCRVSEIAELRKSFVDIENRTIRVIGKGKRERQIPFSDRARTWLERYLEEERPAIKNAASSPYLFLSQKGGPLRRESIWRRVKRHARRTSISEETVHPHVLRHSFATHLLEGGSNLREVQTLLGHANISTTEIYTHLDISELKRRHREFHPRTNMDASPAHDQGDEQDPI